MDCCYDLFEYWRLLFCGFGFCIGVEGKEMQDVSLDVNILIIILSIKCDHLPYQTTANNCSD